MTFTAMRPDLGLGKGREVSLSSFPGLFVDFGVEGSLQRFVGVVGAEEVRVAESGSVKSEG